MLIFGCRGRVSQGEKSWMIMWFTKTCGGVYVGNCCLCEMWKSVVKVTDPRSKLRIIRNVVKVPRKVTCNKNWEPTNLKRGSDVCVGKSAFLINFGAKIELSVINFTTSKFLTLSTTSITHNYMSWSPLLLAII